MACEWRRQAVLNSVLFRRACACTSVQLMFGLLEESFCSTKRTGPSVVRNKGGPYRNSDTSMGSAL